MPQAAQKPMPPMTRRIRFSHHLLAHPLSIHLRWLVIQMRPTIIAGTTNTWMALPKTVMATSPGPWGSAKKIGGISRMAWIQRDNGARMRAGGGRGGWGLVSWGTAGGPAAAAGGGGRVAGGS